MEISLDEYELSLRQPIRTAHGEIASRRIVKVTVAEHGYVGLGEAAPLDGFGLESYAEAAAELERWAAGASADASTSAGGAPFPQTPCAAAAANGAIAKLDAAIESLTLAELLTGAGPEDEGAVRLRGDQRLAVQALVSAQDPIEAAMSALEAANAGHLAVKLKVAGVSGGGSGEAGGERTSTATDIARIVEVRRALPAAVALRLDANGGWDRNDASRVLRAVSRLDIDFVETPTPQPADWGQLARRTGARFAADEHLSGAGASLALDQLIEVGAISFAVIKPATVGGPQVGYEMACRASVSGVGSVVSSFMCGEDGLRIARDLALAVAPSQVHGVGTGGVFERALADDVVPQAGYLRWSSEVG